MYRMLSRSNTSILLLLTESSHPDDAKPPGLRIRSPSAPFYALRGFPPQVILFCKCNTLLCNNLPPLPMAKASCTSESQWGKRHVSQLHCQPMLGRTPEVRRSCRLHSNKMRMPEIGRSTCLLPKRNVTALSPAEISGSNQYPQSPVEILDVP